MPALRVNVTKLTTGIAFIIDVFTIGGEKKNQNMKKQHSKNSDSFDLAKPELREFKDHCLTTKNFQECILEYKFLGQSLSTVRKCSHHHQERFFT